MPIGTIHTAKELAQTYQPLLLATFTFVDGTVLRLSTHGLRTADGGFQYGGNDYLPRILNQEIAAVQALSDGGIDVPPSVNLVLNDADRFLWTNYEVTKGFRGAKLKLTFVFWNVGANDFSSDEVTKFVGICSAPSVDETTLSVNATSLLNMQRVQLPAVRIQKRCPWIFPRTAAERQAAADEEDSLFWECGYAVDAAGGNQRGNNNPSAQPYTSCGYTRTDCMARGMYSQDGLARLTGRFGGVQWDQPTAWKGRNYFSGKVEEGTNTSNDAKYSDPVPLVYGTAWVEPVIANLVGEGTTTRMELILCYGEIDDVVKVVVNDAEIPAATDMSGASKAVRDSNMAWYLVNRGDRNGAANQLPMYGGAGDPYGSLATICVVVPRALAESNAVPRVRVLVKGPRIRAYSTPATHAKVGAPDVAFSTGGQNMNPAWILLELLILAGWNYSEIDLQSFIDAAAICDAPVSFGAQDGGTSSHPRYLASLAVRQRKSASELIRGLRNLMGAVLAPNSDGGKLRLLIERTIALQQPAPVPGSNYNTAVAGGYVAYRFDETNIVRKGLKSSLRVLQMSNGELPNRLTVVYQDLHNNFAADSLTVVDTEAVVRSGGQEAAGNLPMDGLCNFDQGRRLIARWLAKQLRGNPRADAAGTLQFELETTFKVVHLQIGHLCLLDYPSYGITNQLVRVQRIQPSANFEECKVTLMWHSDSWYADTFGQEDTPRYSTQRRNNLARPPWPLLGQSGTGGLVNPDPLYGRERFFALQTVRDDEQDRWSVRMYAQLPVNSFPNGFRPPFVPNEGSTAATGGQLAGNRDYYVRLVAIDGSGRASPPSEACRVAVPAGASTNTISVPGLDWDSGTVQHALWVGDAPDRMHYQGTFSGAPASVSFAGPIDVANATRPIPDPEFEIVRIKVKRVRNAGVFAVEVSSVTSSTIKVDNAYWSTNQWAGYDCSVLGRDVPGSQDTFPMWNFRVLSNTSDTLTVDTTNYSPAPSVIALGNGERYLLCMRTKPTAWTADTITEPNFDNSFAFYVPDLYVSDATNASPIEITSTAHGLATNDRVRIDYVAGNTAANGIHTATVIDANRFTLNGSTGNGAYAGGGVAHKMTGGLDSDEAKGKLLRVIAGKGRGHVYKIRSNTGTVITIEGQWAETPDATTRFITEEPDWVREIDTSSVNVSQLAPAQTPEFQVDVAGHSQRTLLFVPVPVDGGGNETLEQSLQVRDAYVYRDLGLATEQYQSAITLNVYGFCAVGSDLAGRVALNRTAEAKAVRCDVKVAPTGADLKLTLLLGATDWMSITIPAGQTSVYAPLSAIVSAKPIVAGTYLRLDITSVGTTFPGADLSVSIYL